MARVRVRVRGRKKRAREMKGAGAQPRGFPGSVLVNNGFGRGPKFPSSSTSTILPDVCRSAHSAAR